MKKLFALIVLTHLFNRCTTREWNSAIHDPNVEEDDIFQNRLPMESCPDHNGAVTRNFCIGIVIEVMVLPAWFSAPMYR
jgi:hypothetical protein